MKLETDTVWIKINAAGLITSVLTASIQDIDLYLAIALKCVTIISLSAGAAISIIKLIKYWKRGAI